MILHIDQQNIHVLHLVKRLAVSIEVLGKMARLSPVSNLIIL